MATATATSDVQLENEVFRVTKWTIPPGAAIPMHVHEFDYVVVPLTTGPMIVTNSDGSTIHADLVTGVSYTRPAGAEHTVANEQSDQDVVFIEVERLS